MIKFTLYALSFWAGGLFASHGDDSTGRATDLSAFPKYSIEVRNQNSKELIEGLDADEFYKTHPYAAIRPEPFYDKKDADKDRKSAFLIAGANCDSTLKAASQITGVSLDHLNKRAHAPALYDPAQKGTYPYVQTANDKLPEWWKGSQNVYMRASSDGFLTPQQDLRKLLIEDNRQVRELPLNHQMVAAPILKAVEQLANSRKSGTEGAVKLEFGGEWFTVEEQGSGSAIALKNLTATAEEKARIAYRDRHSLSGWIGAGVQGSFFNDELFADNLLKFTRKSDGKVFTIDSVTPHLIYRYGFYQGGKYRHDPTAIANYFKIKGTPGASGFEHCL